MIGNLEKDDDQEPLKRRYNKELTEIYTDIP